MVLLCCYLDCEGFDVFVVCDVELVIVVFFDIDFVLVVFDLFFFGIFG